MPTAARHFLTQPIIGLWNLKDANFDPNDNVAPLSRIVPVSDPRTEAAMVRIISGVSIHICMGHRTNFQRVLLFLLVSLSHL